jgi:hypothetical protein
MKKIQKPNMAKVVLDQVDQIDKYLGLRRGVKVARDVRNKAKTAITDIKSGEIYKNDESMKNLVDVVNDILKGSIMVGIAFVPIPGTSALIPIVRKLLRKSKIEKIRKLLELTVENDRITKDDDF